MIEQTLVLVKPDAVKRRLIGDVTHRFETRGLRVVGMKMVWPKKDFALKHYPEEMIPVLGEKALRYLPTFNGTIVEAGKKVHDTLIDFITQGPVVAIIVEGINAVKVVRKIVGSTNPLDSPVGTIRGDFAHLDLGYATSIGVAGANIVHASGNLEEAKHEIGLWFKKAEIYGYDKENYIN